MPARFDIDLYRGDTLYYEVALWADKYKRRKVVVTGATVAGQIRVNPNSPSVLASFNAGLIDDHTIFYGLTKEVSATFLAGTYSYDVQVTYADGQRVTILTGTVNVTTDVTHGS